MIGFAIEDSNNFSDAVDDYSKYISLNPNDANGYFRRGNAKYDLEDYKNAIIDYTKTISIDLKYSDALLNRGLAKRHLMILKVPLRITRM